jgi:hypothetical protein
MNIQPYFLVMRMTNWQQKLLMGLNSGTGILRGQYRMANCHADCHRNGYGC